MYLSTYLLSISMYRFIFDFLNVVSWSSLPSNNQQGDTRLHDAFAREYHQAGNFPIAEQHYLRGNNPKEYVFEVESLIYP